ncbi:hypothetical protein CONPUDRAFT_160207 [Coniophora puteana RWD-64-598 SS2]|uniref:DUF6532 domain-containing protein n=1 Tax=Coniophora puteana (strain RWD-64-598) TaxID=741705 RepID=R7SF48_CONPW|nr:uncharacterized protein CONPUDRAFT_160207 [Coniophora puteana RWD-64-598 SS2]EIW74505.1 hypothetical protein CONPUDRAFT_160207 [Coniophora puteana RWD-64-598 SS2]
MFLLLIYVSISRIVYQDWAARRYIYCGPVIQNLLNEVFFQDRDDDAIRCRDFYEPFPKLALALIMTAIDCAIDEWHTGKRGRITFSETAYRPVYKTYLEDLNRFELEGLQHNILGKLQARMYRDGLEHAGVQYQPVTSVSMSKEVLANGVAELVVEFNN